MKCLVTGGAGFIGSHVADRLVADGHEVVVIDNLSLGKREFVNQKAEFHESDIRDYKTMAPIFADVEAVFHLAAEPRLPISIADPQTTHEINVTGTLNVFKAAKDAGVQKVVFSSTCAVYGDQELPIKEAASPHPKSPYGLHKLMGEWYARLWHELYGLSTVSLRYFNVFGPRKLAGGGYPMVIPVFLQQIRQGEPLTIVGDGEQTRDYVYVSDVVEANIKAWQSDVSDGSVCNIGSGRQTSVNEIARLIGGPTTTVPPRPGEMRYIEADVSLAKEKLGWQPRVTLEEGIKWLKEEQGI